MYNAGERKDVRRAEKEARIRERERQEVVRGIMAHIPGRAWVLDKLESCHIFHTSFSSDPLTMAFMEGERRQGLILLNDIMQSCPDQYILMMRERNERDAARNTAAERSSSQVANGGNIGAGEDTGDAAEDGSDATLYN